MKAGRFGRLCVCDVANRWARGEQTVLEESQTLVHREPELVDRSHAEFDGSSEPEAPQQAQVQHAREQRSWKSSYLVLGADVQLGSNPLRCGLCDTVELYPGLVVHEPLLATVATNFAERMSGLRLLASSHTASWRRCSAGIGLPSHTIRM